MRGGYLDKRGQVSNGLIGGLVFGIAGLVIGTIIALVIVSTLTGAGLFNDERATLTVSNESSYVNSTGYNLAVVGGSNVVNGSFIIVTAYNATSGIPIVVSGNVSVSNGGLVTNASSINWGNTTLTYTYQTTGQNEVTVNGMSNNFSIGLNNVSGKLPTVLLVAAIVLILGVLAFLVAIWQRMRFGGSI